MASKSGKSITTSVPTISIRFHANDEQVEQLYGSDDEQKTDIGEKLLVTAREKGSNSTGNIQETTEGSPLKYFNLSKRSNSTEVPITDSSPPSDTWKFLNEIKDKIAKSVEDKITEIKSRNQEDGSPSKKKTENSSLSDSEELSESSLSKTCGIVSTTEGAEMSSDEDSASLKNDTPTNPKITQPTLPAVTPTLRQRFRLLKAAKNGSSVSKEGSVSLSDLTKLHNISTDGAEHVLPEHRGDVEHGVECLEEFEVERKVDTELKSNTESVLKSLEVDNVDVDQDGTVTVKEVFGVEFNGGDEKVSTVLAPKGFVDLRYKIQQDRVKPNNVLWKNIHDSYWFYIVVLSIAYLVIQQYFVYFAGMLAGIFVTTLSYYLKNKITPSQYPGLGTKKPSMNREIWDTPVVKEQQLSEGWVNELPDNYDSNTYHISLTQPAYLRLKDNWLRISNTSSKVTKRAMWNETDIKKNFKCHRIYNLSGAKVSLLPVGLAKIRHWSKKYPIYITVSNDQFRFDDDLSKDTDDEKESSPPFYKKSAGLSFRKKMSTISSPQRFSKLCAEQDNFYTDAEVSASISETPSPNREDEESLEPDEEIEDHEDSWSNCTLDESPTETKIYIFGRTDREKEDWYRRLVNATHCRSTGNGNVLEKAASLESILKETEYTIYMYSILKAFKNREEANKLPMELENANVSWINAFLGRILFDFMCDEIFASKIKDRIRRKLATIKLPYFIEELSITELNLGKTSPLFRKITKPTLDDRGLWIDMAMTYEGSVVLTLTTKLNLMKLKQPPTTEKEAQKSAIFHSDVDDSAESSSDEESLIFPNVVPETPGTSTGAGINKSKKLMKMVDRIAESKFFQAATENKYIKRAMEGVSNTDLRLKVEMRALEGTLVINIPPPPSDRIWVGFRPVPELSLSAHPIVGERNITFMHVTGWIEKKLTQEFQKFLVIPNMEDLIIPVMMSKIPE